MPDSFTHYVFGHEVLRELDDAVRDAVDMPVFERALQGPDPWSTLGFWGGKYKPLAKRSSVMHKQKTGAFLLALTAEAKADPTAAVFSLLAGTLCHYCLDRLAHPYIIAKGGDFDGRPETRPLCGGHVRLERAIDSYYLRRETGKRPWRVSLPRTIFRLKRYPESLRRPLDRALAQVYGWDDGFDRFNDALGDERRFYALMQDPFGLVHYLLRPLSRGRTNFSLYSYYRRDIDPTVLDYLNEQHAPWHHPYDPAVVSTDSFFDLFAQAKADAVALLTVAYKVVFLGEALPLSELYANASYSTGFDCDDVRHDATPTYEPLMYRGRYRNT